MLLLVNVRDSTMSQQVLENGKEARKCGFVDQRYDRMRCLHVREGAKRWPILSGSICSVHSPPVLGAQYHIANLMVSITPRVDRHDFKGVGRKEDVTCKNPGPIFTLPSLEQ